MKTPSVEQVAEMFGCTIEQIKQQFRKNAAHIRGVIAMLESGKACSNYTVSDLPMMRAAAENYEAKAS